MAVYDDQDQQEKDELDALNRLSDNQGANPDKERYVNDIPSSILGSSQDSNPDKTEGEENTADNPNEYGPEATSRNNRLNDLIGRGFKSDECAHRNSKMSSCGD